MSNQQGTTQNNGGNKKKPFVLPSVIGAPTIFQNFVLKNPKNGNIYGTVVRNNYEKEQLNPVVTVFSNQAVVLSTCIPKIFGDIKTKIHTTKTGQLMVLADIPLVDGVDSAIFMKPSNGDPITIIKRNVPDVEKFINLEVDPEQKSLIEVSRLVVNFIQLNEFDFVLSIQHPNWKKIILPNLSEEIHLETGAHRGIGLIQAIWPELNLRYKTIAEGEKVYTSLKSNLKSLNWSGQYLEFQRTRKEPAVLKCIEVCPD